MMRNPSLMLLLTTGVAFAASLPLRPAFTLPQVRRPPVGSLEVEGDAADGWCVDPDTPERAMTVRLYLDGPYPQGALMGELTTDLLRADVNQTLGASGLHGFHWPLPYSLRDGRAHTLYAYGVDTTAPEQLGLFYSMPKQFQLAGVPLIRVEPEPYTIGAWYFTAWSSYNDFEAINSLSLYNRKDAWGGVRDHAEGKDPWHLGVDYSAREPLLGFYDLSDQRIMDGHIRMAASSGLSFFAFYWYWNTDKNGEDNVTLPIHTFLTSANKGAMKFLLAPIKLGDAPMTRDIWKNSVVPFMIAHYLSDPSYLTTTDGRPVVIIFDTSFNTVDDNMFAAATLGQQVRDQLGKEPFVLWLYNPDWNRDYVSYLPSHFDVDGYACFQLGPAKPAEPYATTLSRWDAFMDGQSAWFHIPCVSTGLDRRPWWRITWGWNGEGVNAEPYNTLITLADFKRHLEHVRRYLDDNAAKTSKTLIVYAWNEWGEGGILEPSRTLGYAYLDAIQNTFGLIPRMTRASTPTPTPGPTRTNSPTQGSTPSPLLSPTAAAGISTIPGSAFPSILLCAAAGLCGVVVLGIFGLLLRRRQSRTR